VSARSRTERHPLALALVIGVTSCPYGSRDDTDTSGMGRCEVRNPAGAVTATWNAIGSVLVTIEYHEAPLNELWITHGSLVEATNGTTTLNAEIRPDPGADSVKLKFDYPCDEGEGDMSVKVLLGVAGTPTEGATVPVINL